MSAQSVSGSTNAVLSLPVVPSAQRLYDQAQKDGLLPGVGREYFNRPYRPLLFAAVDPVGYAVWANTMLDRAKVPPECRLFDHVSVLKLVEKIMAPPRPSSPD